MKAREARKPMTTRLRRALSESPVFRIDAVADNAAERIADHAGKKDSG